MKIYQEFQKWMHWLILCRKKKYGETGKWRHSSEYRRNAQGVCFARGNSDSVREDGSSVLC